MDAPEFFAFLGFPVRVIGRAPLLCRYIWGASANILSTSDYARERIGPSYKWRPWLLLDARDLEPLERLINEGTDEEVLDFRSSQLAIGSSTAVVGSLLASAAATMLTMNSLSDVNLTVRAMFTISLMLSMLTVFFTLVQQRELSTPTSAKLLRLWLWNGRVRIPPTHHISGTPVDFPGRAIRESSMTAHYVIFAPFELLRIAIAVFLAAVVAYLVLVWQANIPLGTGPQWGNRGLLIAFIICTVFPLLMFGQALGQKDKEMAVSRLEERNGSLALALEEVQAMRQAAKAHAAQ